MRQELLTILGWGGHRTIISWCLNGTTSWQLCIANHVRMLVSSAYYIIHEVLRATTEWQTGETSMCNIGKVCTRHIFTSRQSRLLWLDFSMCLSVWRKWKWNVRGRANLVTHTTTYFHLVLIWCWFSSWSSEFDFRYSPAHDRFHYAHAGRRDLGPFVWSSGIQLLDVSHVKHTITA